MRIILLSGGSGRRLWPLSNDTRSKQFLKLLRNEQGEFESMVQRVYGQIRKACAGADILIATGESQVDAIRSQLGDDVDIVVEPERRDTYPAVALSCAYLALIRKVDPKEAVMVLPVDPYADIEYFDTLKRMEEAVRNGAADLVLMGIMPTSPSSKFGYILPARDSCTASGTEASDCNVIMAERFIEKPREEEAKRLIQEGALINGGVFAFKLGYLTDIVNREFALSGINTNSFSDIRNKYSRLKKISFDYEIAEKAKSVAMVFYRGRWKDIGTWNALLEEIGEKYIGKVMAGEGAENTNVINELSIPIVVLGVKDLVVAASPDGILIADKQKSMFLKQYADRVSERPMCGEGIWGEYKALDYILYQDGIMSLTKHLTVKAGRHIAYLAHYLRDEILTIVDGAGDLVIDGQLRNISRGDVISIRKGQQHTLRAHPFHDLHLIEVQIGKDLAENDFKKFEWQWI